MSTTSLQDSGSRVKNIEHALKNNQRDDFVSYEDKINHYVSVISGQKEMLPEVLITTKDRGCISISQLCSDMSCCFRSKCCTKDIKYYYIADAKDDGIKLNPKQRREAPSEEENKLTNLGLFIELYHEQGEYLPYLMRSAIEYLPTEELKQYWRNWDPQSIEPLDREKANFFREIIKNARKIMEEVREEMMRSTMRKEIVKSRGSCSARIQNEENEPEISFPKTHKYILEGDQCFPFDEEILRKDIKTICKCTPTELNLLLKLVLERLSDACSKQEIWNVMIEAILELNLEINPSKESSFFEEIESVSSRCQAKKVVDLSAADFASLMKLKESEQKKGFSKIKQVVSKSFTRRARNGRSSPTTLCDEDLLDTSKQQSPCDNRNKSKIIFTDV